MIALAPFLRTLLSVFALVLVAAGCGGSDDIGTPEPTERPSAPSVMPMFLLAGQSNMLGYVDAELFENLLAELKVSDSTDLENRLIRRMRNWYSEWNNGYAMYGYSRAMAKLQARELIRLQRRGLIGDQLKMPHPTVSCTRNETVVAPLQTNCGEPIGPELMMGHMLGRSLKSPTSLIKVAKGGTTLLADWRSPSRGEPLGDMYRQLSARIASLTTNPESVHPDCAAKRCKWAAFVYFQGENDSFAAESSISYENNLRALIADVRKEAGNPDLAVVVVQIGAWAKSLDFGQTVATAQKAVVDSDPRARLVTTSDLSGFFHYDPAAQLIIGARVARALRALAQWENPQ